MDIKDVVTLDDGNRYLVASKAVYEDKLYYLLMNKENNELMTVYVDNDELVESEDLDVNTELVPLFYETLRYDKDLIGLLDTLEG